MSFMQRILLVCLAGLSVSALATPVNFTLTSPNSRTGVLDSTYAMGYNYSSDSVNLSLTGWTYGTKTTNTTVCDRWNASHTICTRSHVVTTTAPNNKAMQTYVGNFGASYGLGDEKANTPNHAIDNEGGYYDMLLLSFDQMVTLNSLIWVGFPTTAMSPFSPLPVAIHRKPPLWAKAGTACWATDGHPPGIITMWVPALKW